MADYFTSEHFNLLKKWKWQKRDASNPEQNRAHLDLRAVAFFSDIQVLHSVGASSMA